MTPSANITVEKKGGEKHYSFLKISNCKCWEYYSEMGGVCNIKKTDLKIGGDLCNNPWETKDYMKVFKHSKRLFMVLLF